MTHVPRVYCGLAWLSNHPSGFTSLSADLEVVPGLSSRRCVTQPLGCRPAHSQVHPS